MSDRLVLDASKLVPGVCCGTCREKRHKFSFAANWGQDDGCPCCWTHRYDQDQINDLEAGR